MIILKVCKITLWYCVTLTIRIKLVHTNNTTSDPVINGKGESHPDFWWKPKIISQNAECWPAFHQDNDFKHWAKVAKDRPHQNLHFSMNFSLRTGGGTSLRQEANTFLVIVPILSGGGWMWGSSWFNQTFEQNITTLTRFGYSSRKVIFFVCVIISYLLPIIRSWCWPDLTFTSPLLTDLFFWITGPMEL